MPASVDDRLTGIFFGRAAGNINTWRYVGDRMPGSDGDQLEENLFGTVPTIKSGKPAAAYLRYAAVAAKMPLAARRPTRELPAVRAEYRSWWQHRVLQAPPADLVEARALMRESMARFMRVGVLHTLATLLGGALLGALGDDLAEKATGDRTVAMTLTSGYGSMEETQLIGDLWTASRGDLDIDAVLFRHGYHGPNEGDLRARIWREDRRHLDNILRNYQKGGRNDPREREVVQRNARLDAEKRLLAGLPRWRRPQATLTMKLASTMIPLREVGKAAYLHSLDGARCAARTGGTELCKLGLVDDAEDVFFLTYDEFVSESPSQWQDLVGHRKAIREHYEQLTIPPRWVGQPTPSPVAVDADDDRRSASIQGIGVVGPTVTGRARIIHDPAEADLDEGDIMVCATTDPSWTPLFMMVDALVIDIGGAMSHGAIVARELGVTCVINTGDGTRRIPDGATITVNGSTGYVTIDG